MQLNNVASDLCTAINNGIENSSNYPIAYIAINGALVIECEHNIDKFKAFADIFPEMCSQYQIDKLPETNVYCTQKEILRNDRELCILTFNISPEQFDNLLMAELDRYAGYRNFKGAGGSILLLANSLLEAYKESVI
ncbi:hypothetical protein, partial [Legionella tunisiensis]|uniref:hypothetical protein n=1 Tax=Legionella tunisiensis TaxID=1034944 RepID=UPI001E52B137